MGAMNRGLGRGLDALLGGYNEDVEAPEVMLLSIESIKANPNQPRKHFDEEALKELADSIKSSGLLQPVLVRPMHESDDDTYELVAGERRLRASKMAGLEEVPAIVRHMEDDESLAVALIENLQREDLNVIEEAQGMAHLQQQFGMSQEMLAEKVGKSRSAVANILRLLHLPAEIQEDMRSGRISGGHGRALLAIENDQARLRLRQKIVNERLSVREVEAAAQYFKQSGMLPGEAAQKSTRGKRPKVKPGPLAKLQEELNKSLDYGVSLSGDVGKGKITFAYNDAQQLKSILAAMGLETDVDALLQKGE